MDPWRPPPLRLAAAAPALAVPLAAMAWTLPLQLLHFGAVPLYAVPANLVAAPLLTPLTLGAMALALVAVLAPPLLPPLLVPPGLAGGGLLLAGPGVGGPADGPVAERRPLPLLVLAFALALLGLVLPGLERRCGLLATASGRRGAGAASGAAYGRPVAAGAPGWGKGRT